MGKRSPGGEISFIRIWLLRQGSIPSYHVLKMYNAILAPYYPCLLYKFYWLGPITWFTTNLNKTLGYKIKSPKKKFYRKTYHHLVSPSPWPFLMSMSVNTTAWGTVFFFHKNVPHVMFMGLGLIIMIFSFWMRDIVREATFQGAWTRRHYLTMKLGFVLFMASEIAFFGSFFWAYMWNAVSPAVQIGVEWPPLGLQYVTPWGIPMYNTAILIWSGMLAHTSGKLIRVGKTHYASSYLRLAIALGVFFMLLQGYEFYTCSFTIACSHYGSVFFVLTGFHGLHVIVGTIFLYVQYERMQAHHFTKSKHLGLELGIWYWHLVDGVWIAVYGIVYWYTWYQFGKGAKPAFSLYYEGEWLKPSVYFGLPWAKK